MHHNSAHNREATETAKPHRGGEQIFDKGRRPKKKNVIQSDIVTKGGWVVGEKPTFFQF